MQLPPACRSTGFACPRATRRPQIVLRGHKRRAMRRNNRSRPCNSPDGTGFARSPNVDGLGHRSTRLKSRPRRGPIRPQGESTMMSSMKRNLGIIDHRGRDHRRARGASPRPAVTRRAADLHDTSGSAGYVGHGGYGGYGGYGWRLRLMRRLRRCLWRRWIRSQATRRGTAVDTLQ